MAVSNLKQLVENTSRFREVVAILAKYGFADWLQKTGARRATSLVTDARVKELALLSPAERVRRAITELGTTFIKLGQVLSTRPDLVGMEMADELAELRTGVPPDPPEVVLATIETELGAKADELFDKFDSRALASASIGQVHRATLSDGTAVVVKVQHPNIEDRVRNDLDILARLAEMAEKYSAELRQYRPVDTIAEFSRALLRELDFRGEFQHLERFRRNFKEDKGVHFPKPYLELSSQRVLTMDMLEGINLSNGQALRESDFDLEDLARRGANLFVEMIFRDAFYHADPHPGNLMALPFVGPTDDKQEMPADAKMPSSVIGVIDCGMVGRLDEPLREDIEQALLAVIQGDCETVVEIIVQRGATPDDLDTDELQMDVEDFLGRYAHQSIDRFDLGGCLTGVVDIIRRHKIVLPSKVGMLFKVLIMLEGTAQQLNPNFNLAELIKPYGKKSIQKRYSPKRIYRFIESRYRDWEHLVEILPRDVADILHRMKTGSFDVNLNHRRLETSANRLVMGILSAALFMGSSLMLSQNVPPLISDVSLPGAAGCGIAVWLGYKVIRAIKNMGDIQQI